MSAAPIVDHFDLVIVGFGVAGACAAIEARDRGANVLVLDRGMGGGATALSGGVMYAGGGTPYQKANGYDDTPENMFNYLRQEVKGAVSDATLRRFCDDSVGNLAWLEQQGARYASSLCEYKTSYPTDRHYLYFSGNEKAWPYKENAEPAPRGHRQIAKGLKSGAAFFAALKKSALGKGVVFRPLARVSDLIVEGGRVVGVKYRSMEPTPGHERLLRAGGQFSNWVPPLGKLLNRRAERSWEAAAEPRESRAPAVILSAGGFIFNPQMVKEYAPAYINVPPLGTVGDDGAGIRLGQSAGGRTAFMDRATSWRFITPPTSFMKGIAVGPNGQRMINEDLYGATFTEAMIHQHGGKGYLILDAELWRQAKEDLKTQASPMFKMMMLYVQKLGHKKAATLEALAARIGVPTAPLLASVETYNKGVLGAGDPLHKAPDLCKPLTEGPFYAVDIAVDVSPFFPAPGLTLGGLVVDEETGAVLSESGATIPGLYAAGRTAAGICANGYISGLSLADGVFSGRRAGRAALAA